MARLPDIRVPDFTMRDSTTNTSPSCPAAGITLDAVRGEQEPDRQLEKIGNTELMTETGQQSSAKDRNEVGETQSAPKKSLSFKLAFTGLALPLLVFQVDATCLSIALPVSQKYLLVIIVY